MVASAADAPEPGPQMVLAHPDANRFEFVQRAQFKPALLASMLLGAFAVLPLLGPGSVTATRIAMGVALGLIAILVARASVSPRARVTIDRNRRTVNTSRGT